MPFRARLVRPEDVADPFHDGDTIWLEYDHGKFIHVPTDIRLKDVHAPELKPLQLGAAETRQFVIDWIAQWNVGKWPFWVDSWRTSTYRDAKTLDRFLGEVFNRDRSSCLNIAVQTFVDEHGYPAGN